MDSTEGEPGALELCFHLPAHHTSGSSTHHSRCFSFPFPWVLTAAAAHGRSSGIPEALTYSGFYSDQLSNHSDGQTFRAFEHQSWKGPQNSSHSVSSRPFPCNTTNGFSKGKRRF